MNTQDKKQLELILEAIKTLEKINIEISIDIKAQLKKISVMVSRMTPWKLGSVKDTYDSNLWKCLEYLTKAINNPLYTSVIDVALMDILGDLKKLPVSIREIIKQEEVFEQVLAKDPNSLTIQAQQSEERKKLREKFIVQDIKHIRILMNHHHIFLNFGIMQCYLKDCVSTQAEILLSNNTMLWPGVFRVFEVLGEGVIQASSSGFIKETIPNLSELIKLRDSLVHLADKGSEHAREKIYIILNSESNSAAHKLFSKIIKGEIKTLLTQINFLCQSHTAILQEEPSEAYKKLLDNVVLSLYANDTVCSMLKLLEEYLSQKNKELFIDNEEIKLIKLDSSASSSSPLPGSANVSLYNAIFMSGLILEYVDNLIKIESSEKFEENFQIIPLVRYACEYEIGNIGEIAKKILKSSQFKACAFPDLVKAIEAIDLFRDKLMHHQYDIDDEAVFNNISYLTKTIYPAVAITKIKLEIMDLEGERKCLPSLSDYKRFLNKERDKVVLLKKFKEFQKTFKVKLEKANDEQKRATLIKEIDKQKLEIEFFYQEKLKAFDQDKKAGKLSETLEQLEARLTNIRFYSEEFKIWYDSIVKECKDLIININSALPFLRGAIEEVVVFANGWCESQKEEILSLVKGQQQAKPLSPTQPSSSNG